MANNEVFTETSVRTRSYNLHFRPSQRVVAFLAKARVTSRFSLLAILPSRKVCATGSNNDKIKSRGFFVLPFSFTILVSRNVTVKLLHKTTRCQISWKFQRLDSVNFSTLIAQFRFRRELRLTMQD